tara:strand:+ start:430 stop:873 length:444 start_codon:yes stop_codon:yes gene_type:complete
MIAFLTLCEALDTPFPFHWTRREDDNWQATFTLSDGTPYVCSIVEWSYGWEVTFRRASLTRDITDYWAVVGGTKQEFRIFATVVACVKDFLKVVRPYEVRFSAKEPSRQRLYRRLMSGVAAAIPGYKGLESPQRQHGEAVFTITKTS